MVRPLEETALRAWAMQHGLMRDSAAFDHNWRQQGERGEAEHRLYFDQSTQLWFKSNNLSNYGNWLVYFHAIQLHNWLFPVAPLRFEGFVNEDTNLRPLVSQPHIPAARGATQTEVDALLARLDFCPIRFKDVARQYDYLSESLGVEVNDLHNENALVTEKGEVVVIDPVPMMQESSKFVRLAALAY